MTDTNGRQAFPRLRVIEYASFVAGPYASKLLADMGADVIKIEQPGDGDSARRRGPFPQNIPGPERSGLFLYLNGNKRGITLDVAQPTGGELFRRLVAQADVLIEDSPTGSLADLGLSPEALEQVNPRLIILSITPFGQTGPHRSWKAYEININHVGGDGYATPSGLVRRMFPEREPLKRGGLMGEYYCGMIAAIGLMGALLARQRDGVGQRVDSSKQEAHLSLARRAITAYANRGQLESRDTRELAYGGTFACKDGWAEIIVLQQHEWERLVAMLGNPDWAEREGLHDPVARVKKGRLINEHIGKWTHDKSREEIYAVGRKHQVPTGVYYSPAELLVNAHLRSRGFFVQTQHPVSGGFEVPLSFQKLSVTPARHRTPAPVLGQHNSEVYSQVLGIGSDELARLYQAGVV